MGGCSLMLIMSVYRINTPSHSRTIHGTCCGLHVIVHVHSIGHRLGKQEAIDVHCKEKVYVIISAKSSQTLCEYGASERGRVVPEQVVPRPLPAFQHCCERKTLHVGTLATCKYLCILACMYVKALLEIREHTH